MVRRTKLSRFWLGIVFSVLLSGCARAVRAEESVHVPPLPYDLAHVRHIEAFAGSPGAKELLAKQGFVVTEGQFRQIFEPYLPAGRVKMPTFITVNSAWHTYHVLLEEGVQQLETGQSRLLQRFSERLHQLASARQGPSAAIYRDLAAFAAVGWAAQDAACLERLPTEERAIVVRTLKAMQSGGPALFFGLPLQAENFRPAGFYTETPELSRYFVARRWYATAAFRLKSEAETLRALHLTLLVQSDVELKRLHRELTAPPRRWWPRPTIRASCSTRNWRQSWPRARSRKSRFRRSSIRSVARRARSRALGSTTSSSRPRNLRPARKRPRGCGCSAPASCLRPSCSREPPRRRSPGVPCPRAWMSLRPDRWPANLAAGR